MSPRIRETVKLISTWKAQHGIEALNKQVLEGDFKGLCARNYIKNYQFDLGCNLAGNHWGSATSAFIAAVVLNRTLVLNGEDGINRTCEGSVSMRSWVVRQKVLEVLLKQAGCNYFRDDADQKPSVHDFVDINKREDYGISRRCGYARSTRKVLGYDDLFNSGIDLLLPANNEFLSSESRRRAAILFSSPVPGMARFESYGFLLRSLLVFTNQTVAIVKHALEGIHLGGHVHECLGTVQLHDNMQEREYYTIGLHIRHKIVEPKFEPFYDDASERGIIYFQAKHERHVSEAWERRRGNKTAPRPRQSCVILLASDRAATITHLVKFSAEVGCRVSFIQRDLAAKVSAQQKAEGYEETGPWSVASTSMSDWYLLTHSDYFIGSAASTFSFLIAGEVAARAALREDVSSPPGHGQESSFLWTTSPNPSAPGPLNLTGNWDLAHGFIVMEQGNYKIQRSISTCPLPAIPD